MNDNTMPSLVHNAAETIPTRALETSAFLQSTERVSRRRRRLARFLALLCMVGTAGALLAAHDSSGDDPSARGGFNPGCGAPGSVDLVGTERDTSAETPVVTGKANSALSLISVVTLYHKVAAVTDVRLVVGPVQVAGAAIEQQSGGPFDNPTEVHDAGVVANGQFVPWEATLPAGNYPVYGVIDYVESEACGGLAGQEWNQVVTLQIDR